MVKQRERWIICSSGQGWRLPAVAFDAVQNAVHREQCKQQCILLHCTILHCIALRALHSSVLYCIRLHYTALCCTAPHYIALQCTALTGSTAMHTAAVAHFIALYHLSLPYLSNHSANVKPSKTMHWHIYYYATLSFTAVSESCVSLHVLRYCIKVTERVCIAVHCIVIHQTVMHHTVLSWSPGTIPLHWIWAPNDPNAPNDRAPLRRRVVIRPVVVPIFKIACVSFWLLVLVVFVFIFVFVCLRYTHTAKTSYEMRLIAEAATFRMRVFMPPSVLSVPPMRKVLSFSKEIVAEKRWFCVVKRQRQ